ncbi:hypothetical protein FIV38_21035 [Pseudomonas proteolytica]|nr:hypothetical protein F4W61_18515 [Pseudomonas proteolytica]TWR77678.1 hypothetical protein FIV38_21035 [Pseudomonas proteolytica]
MPGISTSVPTCGAKGLCGSGLARESGVSFSIYLTDPPLSRASPLPHFDRGCVRGGPRGGSWRS